jgi:putative DNA primase/helicase
MAVCHGIRGAGGTFEMFDEWSKKWPGDGLHGYDYDETLRAWETLPKSLSGGGLLREKAQTHDVKVFSAWKATWEGPAVFDDGVDVVKEAGEFGPSPVNVKSAEAISPVQQSVADSIVKGWERALRFNHDSGCWHQFNQRVWEPLPKSIKVGFQLAERWAAMNAPFLGKADAKAVTKANFYDGVENILRQRLVCRQADFDKDPWLLGTPLGTVDLRTGLVAKAKPGDFISKMCAVGPSVREDCPRWLKFIDEICKGDLGAKIFLQQWFGYNLTGDISEQVFLFLYGPGGNGKSVLVDTAAWVMGTYFVKPVADMYLKKSVSRHMQEVAQLAGARMVSISEVPAGSSWDEGRLKDHTGGGTVSANFMRENSFTFRPQFKLTALGNHQPTFPGGISPAIRRRFKMMLLDWVPAVVDKKLEETLRAEGPGILRWMINGLVHPGRGWNSTGLMVPSVVDSVTDEYVADQDVFAAWTEARLEKKTDALTETKSLWEDWVEFRNDQGAGDTNLYSTVKTFASEMDRRGFKQARTNTVRGFRNIVLKSKAKTAFDD